MAAPGCRSELSRTRAWRRLSDASDRAEKASRVWRETSGEVGRNVARATEFPRRGGGETNRVPPAPCAFGAVLERHCSWLAMTFMGRGVRANIVVSTQTTYRSDDARVARTSYCSRRAEAPLSDR